ncbi:hypothetical protein HaLaN_28413, partial [Haematococcus lacustris]
MLLNGDGMLIKATSKEKQRSKPDVSKVLQSARGAHYERRQATLQDSAGAASQLQRSDFARTGGVHPAAQPILPASQPPSFTGATSLQCDMSTLAT